ncbi:Cytochrome c [Candidatus Hodgkinia cicadicola]|nr:Cytochrome c [Candidatus Hodgkinia cicadicola]
MRSLMLLEQMKSGVIDILERIKILYLTGLLSGFIVYPTILSTSKLYPNIIRKQVVIRSIKSKTNKQPQALNTLLLCSSLNRGERYFSVCSGCHSVEVDKSHKLGPNLWNIILRPIAGCSNYIYSPALIKLSDLKWTLNYLNKFIKHPLGFVNGTYMNFSGIKDPVERMDILGYLNYNSFEPLSFNKFKFN